jgi:GntP family gluconate:H+ symporter
MTVMAVALATGLYATHVMVPPTPVPRRGRGLNADLGKVIVFASHRNPCRARRPVLALKVAKKFYIEPDIHETYSDILKKYGKLRIPSCPSPHRAPARPHLHEDDRRVSDQTLRRERLPEGLFLLRRPVVALIIGMLVSLLLVRKAA